MIIKKQIYMVNWLKLIMIILICYTGTIYFFIMLMC